MTPTETNKVIKIIFPLGDCDVLPDGGIELFAKVGNTIAIRGRIKSEDLTKDGYVIELENSHGSFSER